MQRQLCLPAAAERCRQMWDLAGFVMDRNGQHCQITGLMEQQPTTKKSRSVFSEQNHNRIQSELKPHFSLSKSYEWVAEMWS